jgi:hypothetical protein
MLMLVSSRDFSKNNVGAAAQNTGFLRAGAMGELRFPYTSSDRVCTVIKNSMRY